jgi:mono/diheme cytochrome c family protein
MKRNLLLSAITILCTSFLLVAGFTQDKPAAQTKTAPTNLVKRGEYLAVIGGCHDCHTPKNYGPKGPEPDMTRNLSGHPADAKLPEIPAGVLGPGKWAGLTNEHFTAWVGPWGTSFAINLTPDEETGIGTWNEAMFIKAMRTGKHLGEGREILPPMPWQNLAKATDDDLKALFAYFQSIPPVKNAVPDPIPPMQP